VAREASLDAILYQSIRDPEKHCCMAVLEASAFKENKSEQMQNWTLTLLPEEVI